MKKLLVILFFLGLVFPKNSFAQSFPNGYFYCTAIGNNSQHQGCLETCVDGYVQNCTLVAGVCTAPNQPTACVKSYLCDNETGIDTAIGCIPINDTTALMAFVLRWALGIAGGIAILLIIASAFIIMTASGDPKKTQGGKELLTAAISGLVLIIFSVFILQLIGVTILDIF